MIDHLIITNAYVIYAANNSTSLEKIQTRVQFCLQLANDLATPALHLRKGPGRTSTQTVSRLTGKYFPYWSGIKKRCAVCAYKEHIQWNEEVQGKRNYNLVSQVRSSFVHWSLL